MKVLIACGGTGGHILPALRLAEELFSSSQKIDILLVVAGRQIEKKIIPSDFRIIRLDASSIKLISGREFIISFYKILKTSLKSLIILLKFKPHLVVGFGGYASFFLVFFACFLGRKTIIHEENVLMGRTNRLLSPFVDYISIGFIQTRSFFPIYKNKMVLTGNPLRKEFKVIEKKSARDYFGLSSDYFTILVMGGSQGSRRINREFIKSLSLLKDRFAFQVIHLSGDVDYDYLVKEYNSMNIKAVVFSFLETIHYAFSAADLVISRAGAMTISELIFFALPAIIIPYPYAYRHQLYNARVLKDNGCALLIEEGELNFKYLADSISDLVKNPQRLTEMRYNYSKLKNFSSTNLWNFVLSLN